MEVCEVVLSDSSDDLDNIPSFGERVARLKSTGKEEIKINAVHKQRASVIHSISDSEESDSQGLGVFENLKKASPIRGLLHSQESSTNTHNYAISNSDDELPDLPGLNYVGKCYANTLDVVKNTSPVRDCLDSQGNSTNTNDYAMSISDDDLPDLNFIGKSYTNTQDVNLMKDIQELDDLPDLDVEYVKIHTKSCKQVEKPLQKTKKGTIKDIEKEKKIQMREEKKRQKELEKALKESEKEILNSQKPTECLKTMRIIIDHNILELSESQQLFNLLDSNNLKHSIEENIVKNSVVWYRTVTNIGISNDQVVKEEREDPTNVLVLVIPNEEFLKMIHSSVQKTKGKMPDSVPLAEFIVNIKSLHSEMDITCIIIGFDKFMRNLKDQGTCELKCLAKQVHKTTTEQALLELQLQTFINFHFLDNMAEFGNLLCHFTKAVAEAPLRREKQLQKSSAFSWYADVDSNCPVKLAKDGTSFIKLWRQQVMQFQNVGPEMAEAIVSRYPSPRLLLKAYKECASSKEAENLLQDIVVRRNYGPLGTQKRIGPELSFKLYLFFTSKDSFQLLKR